MSSNTKVKTTTPVEIHSFETPVTVEYTLTGGYTVITTGVVAIEESPDGVIVLKKTDNTFSKIRHWLGYDVQTI